MTAKLPLVGPLEYLLEVLELEYINGLTVIYICRAMLTIELVPQVSIPYVYMWCIKIMHHSKIVPQFMSQELQKYMFFIPEKNDDTFLLGGILILCRQTEGVLGQIYIDIIMSLYTNFWKNYFWLQ